MQPDYTKKRQCRRQSLCWKSGQLSCTKSTFTQKCHNVLSKFMIFVLSCIRCYSGEFSTWMEGWHIWQCRHCLWREHLGNDGHLFQGVAIHSLSKAGWLMPLSKTTQSCPGYSRSQLSCANRPPSSAPAKWNMEILAPFCQVLILSRKGKNQTVSFPLHKQWLATFTESWRGSVLPF